MSLGEKLSVSGSRMYRSASFSIGGGTVALKQQRLPRRRAAPQDLLDVGPKADVEHPVGFVEDDELELAEIERAAGHVVEHAAGRADDDLRPFAELFDLLADRLAAIDGDAVDAAAVARA